MKGFVGGIPLALLAAAAQAQFMGPGGDTGGTAMGGPSGDDNGNLAGSGTGVSTHSNVNEWSKDDHSIGIEDTDVYPSPVPYPAGPMVPGMGPFPKRGWGPEPPATVIGGPSGNDEGQSFDMPITGIFHTDVNDFNKDDHSVHVKDTGVHPPPFMPPMGPPPGMSHPPEAAGGPPPGFGGPFEGPSSGPSAPHVAFDPFHKRRWGSEPPATVMGGPSGDDGGNSFSEPITVDTDTNVDEHHQDNHAIHGDFTDVHVPAPMPPQMPWMPHSAPAEIPHAPAHAPFSGPPAAPPSGAAPPVDMSNPPREDHDQTHECVAQVHEVVSTVTKTHYRTVIATATAGTSMAMQTSAVPMQASTPVLQSSMMSAPTPASSYSYNRQSQRTKSQSSYAKIPVDVPNSTPSSSNIIMASSTPMSSGMAMPSGASAEHSAAPSSSHQNGKMFTGDAARLSGGIVSVAAAMLGVLAFVL